MPKGLSKLQRNRSPDSGEDTLEFMHHCGNPSHMTLGNNHIAHEHAHSRTAHVTGHLHGRTLPLACRTSRSRTVEVEASAPAERRQRCRSR